jgi:hypothetical protein
VAHEYTGEIGIDFELNRAAIAFAPGHPIFLFAAELARLRQTLTRFW